MPRMVDVADWAIGLAWALAGGLGWAQLRPQAPRRAMLLLALGLGLGAAAALHWHVQVYQLARRQLRAAGVYEQRFWFKLLLGIAALAVAVLLFAQRRRWWSPLPPPLRLAAFAMVGWALYLFAFTCGLDDLLPAALGTWPGRQLLEGAAAAIAVLAAATARRQSDARTR